MRHGPRRDSRASMGHGGMEVDRFCRSSHHPTWLGYEELIYRVARDGGNAQRHTTMLCFLGGTVQWRLREWRLEDASCE